MKIRRLAAIAALVAAVLPFAIARPVVAAPSGALSSCLWALRGLTDVQFEKVVYWSRNGASRPWSPSTPVERAEAQILNLGYADSDATLQWLRGQGRNALYARGASDSDIGNRRPASMNPPAPTPTPNAYRSIPLASQTLGNAPRGQIEVIGGWAAVRRDGTAAVVCVSFKNVGPKMVDRVLFDFPIFGGQGGQRGALQLDRRGEFSPGVAINGWPDLSAWQGGIGHRGYGDNCTFIQQGVASQPLLHAASASYRVERVEFRDGSVWAP